MKTTNHNYAVILAGGQGSRFWPLSRSLRPKQFLCLHSEQSLFQGTLSRIKSIIPARNIFVVTNQLYSKEIFEYTSEFKIPQPNIIFEPEGKNTAPSVAIASRLIGLTDPEALMLVLPSDHLIKNKKGFRNILQKAFSVSGPNKNNLIVFGIQPDCPATGYGYIKIKNLRHKTWRIRQEVWRKKSEIRNQNVYEVEEFIEKPDIKKAKRYLADSCYFWNSGMFLGYAGTFLEEIKRTLPSLYRLTSSIYDAADINGIWGDIKPTSFDYGVLEKTKRLLMIPASDLGWSDLGSWASLDKILPKDRLTNTIRADVIVSGSRDITVLGKSRLIACLGLENLIIVDTPDALLITRKDKSEEVKGVVERLKKNNRQEYYSHKTCSVL